MESRKEVLKLFEEKKDYMEDRIATGVEANKKGFAFLKFVSKTGEPVSDVEVKVTQKSHDFKYGANLFMLDEFSNEEQSKKTFDFKYLSCIPGPFNSPKKVILPFRLYLFIMRFI